MKYSNLFRYIGLNFWKCLCLVTFIISFLIFDEFWENSINTLWVEPIMSKFIGKEWWVVSIYSIFILLYYGKEFFYTKCINWNRFFLFFMFLVTYLFCFFSGKWNYSTIVFGNNCTAWTNIFIVFPLLCEIILFIKIISHNKKDIIQPNLEIEKVHNVEDLYQRSNLYMTTYRTMQNCFYKEGAFAIAITGIWGSGKTTFMNVLKQQYFNDSQNNNSQISIIEFEPWKSDTTSGIIKNFFTLLCEELKWYYPNISFTLNEYVDLLLDNDTDKFRRGLSKLLLNIFSKEKGPYDIIKESLESGRHKFIVFIDDLDRLGAEEIKEVLRLIRNTANFPFIQFIVTCDKEYVCNTLKVNGIDKSELYIEKFFNVEISLPKSEERIICDALLVRISKTINTIWGISEEEDTRIHDMVYYRSNDYTNSVIDCILVPKILYTIRDVVRFNNLFYLLSKTYKEQKVEIEIEFQDLFYLELLHYRYASIYSVLCNDPLSILELNGTE